MALVKIIGTTTCSPPSKRCDFDLTDMTPDVHRDQHVFGLSQPPPAIHTQPKRTRTSTRTQLICHHFSWKLLCRSSKSHQCTWLFFSTSVWAIRDRNFCSFYYSNLRVWLRNVLSTLMHTCSPRDKHTRQVILSSRTFWAYGRASVPPPQQFWLSALTIDEIFVYRLLIE